MADDPNTPDVISDPPADQQTFDRAYVEALRREAARHRTATREAEAQRDAAISERDSVTAERDTLKTDLAAAQSDTTTVDKLAAAERRALVYEVAVEKALPATLAKRLTGDDRAAIEADADDLLKFAKLARTPVVLPQGDPDAPPEAPNRSDAYRALAGK